MWTARPMASSLSASSLTQRHGSRRSAPAGTASRTPPASGVLVPHGRVCMAPRRPQSSARSPRHRLPWPSPRALWPEPTCVPTPTSALLSQALPLDPTFSVQPSSQHPAGTVVAHAHPSSAAALPPDLPGSASGSLALSGQLCLCPGVIASSSVCLVLSVPHSPCSQAPCQSRTVPCGRPHSSGVLTLRVP